MFFSKKHVFTPQAAYFVEQTLEQTFSRERHYIQKNLNSFLKVLSTCNIWL